MVVIKCNPRKMGNDGRYGCGAEYPLDEKAIIHDKELMCPACGRICDNPLYQGGENPHDYIG